MSKLPFKLLISVGTLSVCFATDAFFPAHQDAAASPEKLNELTRLVSTCPELTTDVAAELDGNGGVLSAEAADKLIAENKRCRRYQAQLPEPARYRLAYAALRNVVSINVPTVQRLDQEPSKPQLQLSMQLNP